MSNHRSIYLAWGVAFVAIALLLVAAGVYVHRVAALCTDNGGEWRRVRCRDVESQACTTLDFDGGVEIEVCSPTTTVECDTICVGARAEVGGP